MLALRHFMLYTISKIKEVCIMAFCRECGEKVNDKAVICIKCGVPLSEKMQKQKLSGEKTAIHKSASFWLSLVTLIMALSSAVSIVYFVAAVDTWGSGYTYFYHDSAGGISGLIFSVFSLFAGIPTLILGIVEHNKAKTPDFVFLFIIIMFIVSLMSFAAGFVWLLG